MRELQVTGAFDIECASWDRFVVGALTDGRTTTIARTADDLVDALLDRGGTWWAWNGGRYDFLLVAEVLRRRGLRYGVSLSGSSATRLTCGGLTLCDAARLCPMTLDQACGIAGIEPLPALGWECQCGLVCGGYCTITGREDLFRAAELASYCARDAQACLAIVRALAAEAAQAGIVLRGTIGSTAWATAQARLQLPAASDTLPRWAWEESARGYYGGRVCVARRVAEYGLHHDLSSAYPSALRATPLPVGAPEQLGRAEASAAFADELEGIYRAIVTVPTDEFLPPLPVRGAGGRVGYPVGRFAGAWTGIELRAAQASGATIERIVTGLVWPARASFFAPLVEDWHDRRLEHGKASGFGAWYRELSNSLTGKLAERPERSSIIVNPSKVRLCIPGDPISDRAGCTRARCTGRCAAYSAIDRWGQIWSAPYWRIGASAHIHWAAYLTAATRIAWRAGAARVGDALVYGATDSVWSAGDAKPGTVGQEMGQWADKGEWADWRCRGPNAYHYVDVNTGEVHVRVAGASGISARDWRDGGTSPDQIVRARGVHTFTQAAAMAGRADRPGGKGLFARREVTRTLPDPTSGWYGDRRWRAGDQRIGPVTITELREHWRGKDEIRSRT